MKKTTLYILAQPGIQNYYWGKNILDGMRRTAKEFCDSLCFLDSESGDISEKLAGAHVLTVGSDCRWLDTAVRRLTLCGAEPIIVSASMLPFENFRCSGVIFELEETLKYCVERLKAAGRNKTVLLGLNPASAADNVKAAAFEKLGDVIKAEREIEECVREFVNNLPTSGYDSAICSNDTVAICLIKHMIKEGFNLPERLYIIGMGDSYVGSAISIPLTGIMFDYTQMGEMAVELYHNLAFCSIKCHMTVSLPCKLVIRSSAPLEIENSVSLQPMPESLQDSRYFAGKTAEDIINVEAIFCESDDIDRKILFGIAKDLDCDSIGEKIFMSSRAVRYRLAKLLKKYKFADRNELKKALKNVMNSNGGENE